MRSYWLAAHLLGFVAWMGGAFSIMSISMATAREPRERLGFAVRMESAILRGLVLPGAVCTVVSGIMLTLSMYSQAASLGVPRQVMVMQGTGILAAIIVLVVSVPTAARVVRLDPVGEFGPLFDSLRKRIRNAGVIATVLALVALVAGAMK